MIRKIKKEEKTMGIAALILGIISGYPVGAKTVANLKENGLCSDIEAERLIAFTNNSGPLFIIGTVGLGIFLDVKIGFLLLLIHILASLTVGFIFRFWKINSKVSIKNMKKKDFNESILYEVYHNLKYFFQLKYLLNYYFQPANLNHSLKRLDLKLLQ